MRDIHGIVVLSIAPLPYSTTAVAPVSFILSSQVVDRRSGSVTLQLNPVLINFTVDTV